MNKHNLRNDLTMLIAALIDRKEQLSNMGAIMSGIVDTDSKRLSDKYHGIHSGADETRAYINTFKNEVDKTVSDIFQLIDRHDK